MTVRANTRIFDIPGPGRTSRVSFERKDGSAGWAERNAAGLWRDDLGTCYSWVELLVAFEPLRQVRVSARV
jgi:hypothetical protein